MSKKRDYFSLRIGIIIAGLIIGVLAALLQKFGNPINMGLCMACFERDIVGALGLHRTDIVQYLRPEIMAILLGATIAALAFREFRARTGSAPIVRFVLGMFAMIGALVFLGCPWRAILRLVGGDWNAIIGIAGLVAGITAGVMFLKSGYNLGRSYQGRSFAGWVMPVIMIALLLLAIIYPKFGKDPGPVTVTDIVSKSEVVSEMASDPDTIDVSVNVNIPGSDPVTIPGSELKQDMPPEWAIFLGSKGASQMSAPFLISLIFGLAIGFLAQRTRFCTMGSFRDVILMGDTHLISGLIAFAAAAFVMNLVLGQFNPGFTLINADGNVKMQFAAHTVQYLNFLGMMLAGLCFALAGGCPGRQLILSGEGDGDAGVFVLGMFAGAGIAHNFHMVGKGDYALLAVIVGLIVVSAIGFLAREK